MNPGEWVRKRGSRSSAIGVIIKTVCDPYDGRQYVDVLWASGRPRRWRTPIDELEIVQESESFEGE